MPSSRPNSPFRTPVFLGLAVQLGLLTLALWGLAPSPAAAAMLAPEPEPVPKRWQFDIQTSPLRLATLQTREGPRPFFFMTYKVTNNSSEDLLFAPLWELATDDGTIRRSGLNVPRAVTRDLLSRYDNPLLLDQLSILGRLLQGPENAKEGIVVWPADDLDIDEITVFAAGFSGEFRSYEVPDPENPGQTKRFVLRKTYLLRYCAPGVLVPSPTTSFEPCERPRWIMR